MSANDEWSDKYYQPVVENKIVGYSGIDPARKMSADEQEEIAGIAERVLNAVVNIKVGD